MELQSCLFRQVDDDGHILCAKLKSGDREISPRVCSACPVAEIRCVHLRAALSRTGHPPLLVRYGSGKTELWEESAPAISFASAACAVRTIPIRAPQDCTACSLWQDPSSAVHPPIPLHAVRGGRRTSAARPAPSKIIQGIQWRSAPDRVLSSPLSASLRGAASPAAFSSHAVSASSQHHAPHAELSQPRGCRDEKSVGWTD